MYQDFADHLLGGTPILAMSEKCRGVENFGAYRDEVPVLGIVETCMKRKDKVVSAEHSERSLLIENRAAGDFSAGFGELVDGFESIQVRGGLLPHEVNGRICSLTQGAQELVITEARDAGDRLGTDGADGSLKKRRVS
jgi:hypothetical protein